MRKLDPHQVTAARLVRGHGVYGLGMAPGTGKTLVAIRTHIQGTSELITGRRDDFLTWQQELQMEGVPANRIWMVDENTPPGPALPDRWYFVTYDGHKEFHRAQKKDEDGVVLREATHNTRIPEWIKSQPFGRIIWDEFHSCKHWKSDRTKANFKNTRHIGNRLGMTGTAITNKVKDVFALCKLLDNGKLFGDNEFWFMKRYYIKDGKAWYQKRKAKAEVQEKMKKLWYYVHEDDVLKLPPCRPVVKGVPMTGGAATHVRTGTYPMGGRPRKRRTDRNGLRYSPTCEVETDSWRFHL